MDLNYTDSTGKDLGAVIEYYFDIDINSKLDKKSNTFEIKTSLKDNMLQVGGYLYIDETEYGGRIDNVKIDTAKNTIYHSGRNWRGILGSKIISPDAGSDYFVVSGEANNVLGQIISKIGLSAFFVAESFNSDIEISNFKFRYTNAYLGIMQMLKTYGAKLNLRLRNGKVVLAAFPIIDFSNEGEISSDTFDFVIEKKSATVNHLIGLGRGELSDREVVHKYLDKQGNISDVQVFSDADTIDDVFDYPNCESLEELNQKTEEKLLEKAVTDSVAITEKKIQADIGDKFLATETTTGLTAIQYVTNKIVTIENDKIKINYKVGDTL